MKKFYFLTALCPFSFVAFSQNVTIMESRSLNAWEIQDTIWQEVAIGMGLNATIVPQNTLELPSNLASTDVLIVSSSLITLTPEYIQTLTDYVLNGGSVYVQSEYLVSFQGNNSFDALMQSVGANFNWGTTSSGSLVPMNVFGTLSTTPNIVPTLSYFNFGLPGSGSGVDPFLEFNGANYGFCYVDPLSVYGTVITISDSDWAIQNASPLLMENILAKLYDPATLITGNVSVANEIQIFPNPTSNELRLDLKEHIGRSADVRIHDETGKDMLKTRINSIRSETSRLDVSSFPAGIYVLSIQVDGQTPMSQCFVVNR